MAVEVVSEGGTTALLLRSLLLSPLLLPWLFGVLEMMGLIIGRLFLLMLGSASE